MINMKHTILLPVKALSINKYKCRDQRYLTSAAKDFISTVLHLISEEKNAAKLKELRDYFNPKKHMHKVSITQYYPNDEFFTAEGSISSRTMDCSNFEKVLIDILLLPKHYGNSPPNTAQNLKIDDKFIVDLNSKKRPSMASDHLLEVEIEIAPLSELYSE